MAQADGLLMQTDDIHNVKLPGTSWLVHVAYAANKLAVLYLNGWLVSTSYSETLHLPQLHLIYMLLVQQQYVSICPLNTHSTVSALALQQQQ